MADGKAHVWICKDFVKVGVKTIVGCGFLGLYKPEYDRVGFFNRKCPSCGKAVTYKDTGDVAVIKSEPA